MGHCRTEAWWRRRLYGSETSVCFRAGRITNASHAAGMCDRGSGRPSEPRAGFPRHRLPARLGTTPREIPRRRRGRDRSGNPPRAFDARVETSRQCHRRTLRGRSLDVEVGHVYLRRGPKLIVRPADQRDPTNVRFGDASTAPGTTDMGAKPSGSFGGSRPDRTLKHAAALQRAPVTRGVRRPRRPAKPLPPPPTRARRLRPDSLGHAALERRGDRRPRQRASSARRQRTLRRPACLVQTNSHR